MNKVYEKITLMLIEDTPSQLQKQAAKAGIPGFEVRPEDKLGIDPGIKRVRIRKRKKQDFGFPSATGGVKRLQRKLKSKIYTPAELDRIRSMLNRKTAEGEERAEAKKTGKKKKGKKKPKNKFPGKPPGSPDADRETGIPYGDIG